MFPLVRFIHHLCDSSHGAPGKRDATEKGRDHTKLKHELHNCPGLEITSQLALQSTLYQSICDLASAALVYLNLTEIWLRVWISISHPTA